jgi:hypothetical protein
VWQAKRYPVRINWSACEESLKQSIARWKPGQVIFALPRDLSQQYETAFQTRLVAPGARHGVEVGLWNASEIVHRLHEASDLKTRFFGRDQEGTLEKLDRVIKTGGQLEDIDDLLERAPTLSEFAEGQDRDFTYNIASSSVEAPAPASWDDVPYVTMTAVGPEGRVQVTAWPRKGATVQPVGYMFTPDDAGERARRAAVRSWARGEDAVIREGAQIRMEDPSSPEVLAHYASAAGVPIT